MKGASPERFLSDGVRLAAEGLTKKFGPVTAVEDVALLISAGSCLSVFGPNGAGKTTLLKMLSLLIRPTKGKIWVNGALAYPGSE